MGVLTFAAASYVFRSIYQRLERRGVFEVEHHVASRPTAWIDGLRGIAAIGVVSAHISACIATHMAQACCAEGSEFPSVFQLPPLRLLAAGHSWLALFFLLSGLSSALGPVRLARSGRIEQACTGLARSALRRPLRFVLPASVATVLSWLVCQLGGYAPARRMKVSLLSTEALAPSLSSEGGVLGAVADLCRALYRTWVWLGPENDFEGTQHALVHMLCGSYLVYGVLLATVGMRAGARVVSVLVAMSLSFDWSWRLAEPQTGFAYLAGVLLAEFWHTEARARLEATSALTAPVLMLFGVAFMAWAKGNADQIWWTRVIDDVVVRILPRARDAERLVGTLGVVFVVAAVMITPRMRKLLSRPFPLWLGNISFAVCLVHMMVLRLAIPWLIFICNPAKGLVHLGDLDSPDFKAQIVEPGLFRKSTGVALLLVLILTAAQTWTRTVSPKLEKLGKQIEGIASASEIPGIHQETVRESQNGLLPEYNKSKPI